MNSIRKTIVYIATSLDGFIAKPNDDLSFLNVVQKEGEDYGYGAFIKTIDTVIIGRKTYDWIMTQVSDFPHANKTTFVITRSERSSIGNTHFYSGDLNVLIKSLKEKDGKNIFIDGGAEIVNALLMVNLVDELIISVIPVLLGNGVSLFKDGRPEQGMEFVSVKTFDTGLVQLHYRFK